MKEIADVIGVDAALRLVANSPRIYSPCHPSGRVVLYVPRSMRPDHPLVALLGWDAAHKLARAFGGEILRPADCVNLSRAERDAAIRRMVAEGIPAVKIAEHFSLTPQQVRNIARRKTPDVARETNFIHPASA